MNNSWGCPPSEGCAADTLQTIVNNTQAAGIFVEVSAGNAGPGCSTVNDPPAIYAASYSTGALTTGTTSVASFSSRGPVTVDGSNRIKPDIVAPGVEHALRRRTASDSELRDLQRHLDGRPARGRRRRPPLAGGSEPEQGHRGDQGASERHGESEHHAEQQLRPAAAGASDPEQQLRARSRGRARGRPGRRASATAATSATSTSASPPPPPPPPPPPAGNWTNVAPLPQSVFGGAAATDGTYAYVFGGYHFPAAPGSTLDTVYRYNLATDTWTQLANMPNAALVASAVYYPTTNKIYVFGGSTRTPDPLVTYDVTRIYDIATNTWTMGATMPGPRSQMASGYNPANGKIYLNGGYAAAGIDTVSNQTWEYDPVANSFAVKTPSPATPGQGGTTSEVINGKLYLSGGRTITPMTSSATWGYDIATDAWTTADQLLDMPMAKNTPGRAVVQGQLYAIGGTNLADVRRAERRVEVRRCDEHLVAGADVDRSALVHGERGCRQHGDRCGRARQHHDLARQRGEAGRWRAASASATATAAASTAATTSTASAATASTTATAATATASAATTSAAATTAAAAGPLPRAARDRAQARRRRGRGSAGPAARSAASAAFAPGDRCAAASSARARGRAQSGAAASRSSWWSAGASRNQTIDNEGRPLGAALVFCSRSLGVSRRPTSRGRSTPRRPRTAPSSTAARAA